MKLILLVVIILSTGIKLYCLNFYDIPPADAKLYNYYGSEIAKGNGFPEDAPLIHNIGFSFVLAFLFQYADSNDIILQKIFTLFLSSLLIPLMFMFLRNWFEVKYSVIGSMFVAFDPRIIQNSILGVSDMLYLVLFFASLVFLVKGRYHMSFLFAGLATVTRLEGIILLPILFLLSTKMSYRYTVLFFIPIILVGLLYVYEIGEDNISYQIKKEIATVNTSFDDKKNTDNGQPSFLKRIINSFVYMGWFTFPMFFFFVPTSFYFLKKQKKIKPLILISCIIISATTGVWAYFDAYDTRYFFHMYPFLTMLSLFTWQKFFPVRNSVI